MDVEVAPVVGAALADAGASTLVVAAAPSPVPVFVQAAEAMAGRTATSATEAVSVARLFALDMCTDPSVGVRISRRRTTWRA
jgi:hypothetical protein